jgi:hypothetical protein
MEAKRSSEVAFNELHGVLSQTIELYITTAVRISNPTYMSDVDKLLDM